MIDTADSSRPIADDEISVVIQGPVYPGRPEGAGVCVESVRAVLPNAEIILSTWEGEDTSNIPPCVLTIKSTDPGCHWETPERACNVNRLLVSTQVGLQKATRKHCLKLRSDTRLLDRRFLRLAASNEGSIFSVPLTIANLYVRHPEKYPLLFHVSDCVQFGLTSDLRSYWDSKLFARDYVLLPASRHAPLARLRIDRVRLTSEQALCTAWLARAGQPTALPEASTVSRDLLERWRGILLANFWVIDWQDSGIVFPEKIMSDPSIASTLLTERDVTLLRRRGFDYQKARVSRYFSSPFLVHHRMAALVSHLRVQHPRMYTRLRALWNRYLAVRE